MAAMVATAATGSTMTTITATAEGMTIIDAAEGMTTTGMTEIMAAGRPSTEGLPAAVVGVAAAGAGDLPEMTELPRVGGPTMTAVRRP